MKIAKSCELHLEKCNLEIKTVMIFAVVAVGSGVVITIISSSSSSIVIIVIIVNNINIVVAAFECWILESIARRIFVLLFRLYVNELTAYKP